MFARQNHVGFVPATNSTIMTFATYGTYYSVYMLKTVLNFLIAFRVSSKVLMFVKMAVINQRDSTTQQHLYCIISTYFLLSSKDKAYSALRGVDQNPSWRVKSKAKCRRE